MKLSDIGPGLLLAATGIGVGDMVSSTIAGAEYGLTLVWALVFGVIIKFAITEGAARWQLATGITLIEGWRDALPRLAVAAFFLYFIVWSYFVSSALVTASALVPAAIMPSVPLPVWGVVHALAALAMVWVGRYDRFLAIIKWFVGLKFGAIIASALLIVLWSGADWSNIGAREPFSVASTLSLIGGVGGTVTLLSYGYWMREAGWRGAERLPSARTDLTLSFTLVFIFCFSMIFLSTQINWQGAILDEGPRLCLMLADRIGQEIGPIGRAVFLLGFWGAAFSSVLGVYHGVPFLFDDMLHVWRYEKPQGLNPRTRRRTRRPTRRVARHPITTVPGMSLATTTAQLEDVWRHQTRHNPPTERWARQHPVVAGSLDDIRARLADRDRSRSGPTLAALVQLATGGDHDAASARDPRPAPRMAAAETGRASRAGGYDELASHQRVMAVEVQHRHRTVGVEPMASTCTRNPLAIEAIHDFD